MQHYNTKRSKWWLKVRTHVEVFYFKKISNHDEFNPFPYEATSLIDGMRNLWNYADNKSKTFATDKIIKFKIKENIRFPSSAKPTILIIIFYIKNPTTNQHKQRNKSQRREFAYIFCKSPQNRQPLLLQNQTSHDFAKLNTANHTIFNLKICCFQLGSDPFSCTSGTI